MAFVHQTNDTPYFFFTLTGFSAENHRMDHMGVEENFERVRALLGEEVGRYGLKEVMGVASFSSVYKALMPVQRVRLRKFSGDSFDELLKNGSIVSIAFASRSTP
jgi:hypothetical protein